MDARDVALCVFGGALVILLTYELTRNR